MTSRFLSTARRAGREGGSVVRLLRVLLDPPREEANQLAVDPAETKGLT